MASNTHATATVRLQLDLSGLVTQLRELADTLEATMGDFPCCAPKADDDHEPDIPTACENCNTTYAGCDERLAVLGRTCCKPCEVRDTHKAVAWEMWRWPAPTTTPLAEALRWKDGSDRPTRRPHRRTPRPTRR